MESPKLTLEDITGYLGIGSLQVLGISLVLDGMFGVLSLLEVYTRSAAWALLVSIPLVVTMYLLGLLSVLIGEVVFSKLRSAPSVGNVTPLLYGSENERIWRTFVESERHRRLLKGCALGFLMLAVGGLVEGFYRSLHVANVCSVGALIVAGLCPIVANHIRRDFERLASTVLGQSASGSDVTSEVVREESFLRKPGLNVSNSASTVGRDAEENG